MDSDSFITTVARFAGIGQEEAERAARATLQTLAERIAEGEARDLAEQLPPELGPWLATTSGAEPFDVDEFLRRIAEREGVDPEDAERRAKAVFAALGAALSADEFADLTAELPKDYWRLLPRGPYVAILPADEFLRGVADRAGIDVEPARRATDAVLETLAERIAGGEVDDLVSRLPTQLHVPLKLGREQGGEEAMRMPFEEFLRRVAEREGASPEEAREHARAVFVTLREAVGDDEFFDVTAELPDEYVRELARL
jgi:uncharacterized protein (DUF2267 family)